MIFFSSPPVTLVLLMLQFLLSDYLAGYHLPSLRKTVTGYSKIRWTLEPQVNSYTLVYLSSAIPQTGLTLVDKCDGRVVAIRIDDEQYVIGLLEDGSERRVNVGEIPYHDKADIMIRYLIEGE